MLSFLLDRLYAFFFAYVYSDLNTLTGYLGRDFDLNL